MKCFYHPEKDAVMTCSSCGKGLCEDCVVQKNEKVYCRQCDARLQGGLDAVEAIAIIFGSTLPVAGYGTCRVAYMEGQQT